MAEFYYKGGGIPAPHIGRLTGQLSVVSDLEESDKAKFVAHLMPDFLITEAL